MAKKRTAPRWSKKRASKKRKVQEDTLIEEEDSVFVVALPHTSREPRTGPVHLVPHDPQVQPSLSIGEDRLTFSNAGGFRSARASHGVYAGTWYYELEVKQLGPTGHCRVGMCTYKMEIDGPVGFDQHGYGYRDVAGSKVHDGRREPYGTSFAQGDVLGVLIHLPPGGRPIEVEEKCIVKHMGGLYYVEDEEPQAETLTHSKIIFFKNGVSQGVAFKDLPEGTYYPAASLFTIPSQQQAAACATFNFGPAFKHPPPSTDDYQVPRPFSEVEHEHPYKQQRHKKKKKRKQQIHMSSMNVEAGANIRDEGLV